MLFLSIVGLVNLLKYQLNHKTYLIGIHFLQSSFTQIKVHTGEEIQAPILVIVLTDILSQNFTTL
jgi:hypothetical protein